MTYARANPGFIDDDPGLFGDEEPFLLSLDDALAAGVDEASAFDSRNRELDAEIDEEKQSERRTEAAQSRGGISPRVLQLAEPGLRGGLTDAQKTYEALGEKLDGRALDRQARRDVRDARRLLEDSWGVNALRLQARPSTQKRFKPAEILAKSVTLTLDPREPTATLQAAASFSRKYVPMGRGRMGQRMELKGVYYGIEAQDKADRDYAQMLIDEGIKLEARLADLKKRLVPSSDNQYTRVVQLLEENKQQKKALVTRRLQTVEDLLQMKLLPDDEVEKLRQAQKPPPRVRPPR